MQDRKRAVAWQAKIRVSDGTCYELSPQPSAAGSSPGQTPLIGQKH
jgi:hypothetical protein